MQNLTVIVGGPEVCRDSKYIWDNDTIDMGVIGEGELTFVQIIHSLLKKTLELDNIKGICYKRNDSIVFTPQADRICDLSQIPSPWLLGVLDPKDYAEIFIETTRGCPYRCAYCNYRRISGGQIPFLLEKIREEILLAVKRNVKRIRFIDANFNISPHFKEVCKIIKEVNADRELFLSAEIRAESVNEKVASLLQECGLWKVGIGLQSINPITLRNIHRPTNLAKWMRGVNFLKEKGLLVSVNLIIGLPGDTLNDIKIGVNFLKCNNVSIGMFTLIVLPGTDLRRDASKYRIKYEDTPPYLIKETRSFSSQNLKKAMRLYWENRKELSSRYTISPSTVTYSTPKYPYIQSQNGSANIQDLKFPINKVVLKLDLRPKNYDKLPKLAEKLAKIVGNPLAIWFTSENLDKAIELMKSFLKPIAIANPYLYWEIFLETKNPFSLSILDKIRRVITYRSEYKPSSSVVWVAQPYKSNVQFFGIFDYENNWLNKTKKNIQVLWSTELNENKNWKSKLQSLLQQKDSTFVIDFHPDSKMDFVIKALKLLKEYGKDKLFLFKNLGIPRLINGEFETPQISGRSFRRGLEGILSFDRKLCLTSIVQPDDEAIMDMIEWSFKFKNIA